MAHRRENDRPLRSTISSYDRESSKRKLVCSSCKSSIVALLLWNAIVGFGYILLEFGPHDIADTRIDTVGAVLGAYGLLGIVQMLYPIGGLVGDIFSGRYKVVAFGITITWLGCIIGSVIGVFGFMNRLRYAIHTLEVSLFAVLVLGFSAFRSNSVQFSIDQLQDASSEKISLFLHWFVWTEYVGKMVSNLWLINLPQTNSELEQLIIGITGFASLLIGTVMLIWTCSIRKSFFHERISSNPYWNVWRVIKYTVKHGKPLSYRSAFTYSDDIKPTRMDFAKRLYGGPYETETVEDVKAFLRIVIMLLAITPTYLLDVPTSHLFQYFAAYLGGNKRDYTTWVVFNSGVFTNIITVVVFPFFIIGAQIFLKKWLPRMTIRIGLGITLIVASVSSMFVIETGANYTSHHNYSGNITTCFLLHQFKNQNSTLEFPQQVLLVPELFNGIGGPLLRIAILEFISAQSPHAMKGLLLGVFYAFRGLFITLGSVAALPFALESLWDNQHGILDCGFLYYLCNSVFGVFGLVVFILAARWYRYRERDDPPYRHQYAEDYYSHYEDYKQADYGTIAS